MSVIRHYAMTAADGRALPLGHALSELATAISAIAGCDGVEILQDVEDLNRFVFIERWSSQEAYAEGGPQLGKAAFGPAMALLANRPLVATMRSAPGAGPS